MKRLFSIIFLVSQFASAQTNTASRDYSFYPVRLLNLILSQKLKPTGGSEESHSGYGFFFQGGRNFGLIEVGPVIGFSNFDYSGGVKESEQTFGAYGQYNFEQNVPGNSKIPYVNFEINSSKSEDTTGDKLTGTKYYLRAGYLYFPMQDVFAIDPTLEYSVRKYKPDVGSDYEYNGIYFKVDFRIYL